MHFGGVSVDPRQRTLAVDGEPRHLEPRAFDLLAYLVAHRDRVLSKEELLDEVWGDQFVSESALTTRIKEIRQAVGDDGVRQEAVKNFRGRGYRWVATETETPVERPSLVGRQAELDLLTDHVERSSLVTITGAGGVGKTSIAAEVARRFRDLPDGAAVVLLAPVHEPRGVLPALALELGEGSETSDSEELLDRVASLAGLVVLDNCEHLIEAVAHVVSALHARGGPLRIVATSRERLGIPGEQVFPLSPLDRSAAATLLERRVHEAHPNLGLPDEPDRIAELLAAVDHLPLGIEMVAPLVATLGLDGLLEYVAVDRDLLRSADHSADARHRDLRSLVEWSLDLLEPSARQVLVDMSVFAGPATVAQLAAVLERSPSELGLHALADLSAKSLITIEADGPSPAFGMLETIRAVVAPRRSPVIDARHANAVATMAFSSAGRLLTTDEPDASAEFDALIREIRAAFRWASAHDLPVARRLVLASAVYAHERQWPEPAAWAEQLAGTAPIADLDHALASVLAHDASNRGDYDRAVSLANHAAESPVAAVRASALSALADVGMYRGDLEAARVAGAEVRRLGAETGDGYMWSLGHANVVLADVFDGRVDSARRELAVEVPPMALGPTSEAWLAYAAGEVALASDDLATAVSEFERAIRLGRPIGSRFVVTVAEVARLTAITRSGDTERAIAAFAPLMERYRHLHSATHVVTALRHVVVLLVRAGHDEPAMQILGAVQRAGRESYGAEADLLADARARSVARCGSAEVTRWLTAGADHDLAGAATIGAAALAAAQT